MTTKIRIFTIFASLMMLTVIAMPMVMAETEYEYDIKFSMNHLVSPPIPPHREYKGSPLHLIEICPTIESSTPYFKLLIAAACDGRQEIIFEAIGNYSQVSEEEQKALKEFVEDIWEKYPVTYKIVDEFYLINEGIWQPFYEEEKYIDCDDVKSNYIVTLYQFDMDEIDAQNIKLTDAENEMLGKVFESLLTRAVSLTNAYNNVRDTGSDTRFGILWRGDIHQDMTRIAVGWWICPDRSCPNLRNQLIETAAVNASRPDHYDWIEQNQVGQFIDDCWIEQALFIVVRATFFGNCERSTLRRWTHGYVSASFIWPRWPGYTVRFWTGGAPEEARRFGGRARNYVNSRQWINAFQNIGYASHFLTDVGQPMHTGELPVQILAPLRPTTITIPVPIPKYLIVIPITIRLAPIDCIHTIQYYDFIRNNWQSGENFKRDVINDNIGWWITYPHNCPDFVTKCLAKYSNRYVTRLVIGILYAGERPDLPSDWQNCPVIIGISRNVLIVTMRLNRGLVWYALQDFLAD